MLDYNPYILHNNSIKFLSFKNNKFRYIWTFLLTFLSSSVILSSNRFLLTVGLLVSMFLFFEKKKVIDKEFIWIIITILLITLSQYFQFSFISLNTTLGTLVRFCFPYFVIRIIGIFFPIYYINIIYFFSIISFIFYIPSLLIPNFINFIDSIPSFIGTSDFGQGTNFFIYTVEKSTRMGIIRNSGPFWEPGQFSCYLTIALMFNLILKRKIKDKKNLVFILAILFTFSTSGYIALFLLLTFYFITISKRKKTALFLVPILVIGSWYLYFELDFMGNKINNELQAIESGEIYAGRIGSAERDIKDIMKYPLFGRGRNVETRFDNYDESEIREFHRTNGITDFAVKYGIIFWIIYFYLMLKSFRVFAIINAFDKYFSYFLLIIVFTIGFSQTIFQHSLFISLIYLHVLYKPKNVINDKSLFKVNKWAKRFA